MSNLDNENVNIELHEYDHRESGHKLLDHSNIRKSDD